MNIRTRTRTRAAAPAGAALILAVGLALAGCAPSDEPTAAAPDGAAGDGVTITDAWVMSAESGMSAAFGELANTTDHDLTVVEASSAASTMLELHETVENETGEMVMRQVEGGFVIRAGSTITLEPGGDHIMLMDLTAPLEAGTDVSFTLTFDDGSTFEYAAPVKDFAGANETYESGHGESGHDGHDDHEHDDEHEGH